MRESFRPMLRLALFGTYTIVAIGLSELKTRLRRGVVRVPSGPLSPPPGASRSARRRPA